MQHRFAPLPAVRLAAAAFAVALAFPAGAAAQALPTAERIVERYIEAVGGRDAFARQRYRTTVSEMSAPAMGMTITMEVRTARPNKMITKMTMPGLGEMSTGYDGTTAWAMNPMQGPRIIQGAERSQLVRQADFDAALDMRRAYPTMETVRRTEHDGRPCHEVRMVSADGDEARSCFDVETGLLVSTTTRQETEMGAMEGTITFSEYREFGGVKMPAVTRMTMMGQEMVLTVKSVSFEPVPDSAFTPPAEVRALVGN